MLYRDLTAASRYASAEAGIFLKKVKIIRNTVGITSQPGALYYLDTSAAFNLLAAEEHADAFLALLPRAMIPMVA